jgi:acetyl-CoA carboxylase carboxyl transferase subunit beta
VNWFERMKSGLKTRIKREVPEGIWTRCDKCGHSMFHNALARNSWICPKCGFHLRIGHEQYVSLIVDSDTFTELDPGLTAADPLKFKDHKRYSDRIKAGRKESGMNEAVYTGIARIGGHEVALGIMDSRFIMGSLGSATGEKISRLIDRAITDRRSLILICQSGGARMQESAYSLMQMAKVSAKLHQLSRAGLLYIAVLTDPTYGGVTASFGMLGDVILAEPGARIGFAGPSVIKQFLGSDELPEGFQVAESVLEHGFVDAIVKRDDLAATLTRLIGLMAPGENPQNEVRADPLPAAPVKSE